MRQAELCAVPHCLKLLTSISLLRDISIAFTVTNSTLVEMQTVSLNMISPSKNLKKPDNRFLWFFRLLTQAKVIILIKERKKENSVNTPEHGT